MNAIMGGAALGALGAVFYFMGLSIWFPTVLAGLFIITAGLWKIKEEGLDTRIYGFIDNDTGEIYLRNDDED